MTLTLPPITATATVTTMVAITTAFSATTILGFTKPITAIATLGARIAVTTLVVEDTALTIIPTTAITVSRFMEVIEPIMIEVTVAIETTAWEIAKSRAVAP